jgi:hypothetical protein
MGLAWYSGEGGIESSMRPCALVSKAAATRRVLIAIAAPRVWPKRSAETLIIHTEMQIETPANEIFRRTLTEREG